MDAKSLDDIGYDDVREIGLHSYLDRAVSCRISHEVAKRLESLSSDAERVQLVDELELGAYKDSHGRYRDSYGLVMNWEKLDNIYIPKKWRDYLQNKSSIGILSADEIMCNPKSLEEQVFNETILNLGNLSAITQMYFFIFYSEWRRNVMKYAKGRLNSIAQDLKGSKPGYEDNETARQYISLIVPLVERYKKEVAGT